MTKVLVVDDSALMRRLLTGVLTGAGFEVSQARNGIEAIERLTEWQPDVVTLDVNMPEMDGLTALSLMMQARPTPVVMVSSLTAKGAAVTFEALALGAVDFIAKPGGTISLSLEGVADELIAKVRTASRAHQRLRRPGAPAVGATAPAAARASFGGRDARSRPGAAATAAASPTARADGAQPARAGTAPPARAGAALPARADTDAPGGVPGVVLIGVSTGGPQTLEDVLPQLPAGFPWPVLVAQHMPANFTDAFAQRMDRLCALAVREVGATMPLEAGCVYIGKGGTDLALVERLGRLAVQPRPETPGHPWHPSTDVLVGSAMRLMPPQRIVGVLLTGMGDDGARSMAELHARGGRTIAESEDSAIVFGMPQELIERGGASVVLRCDEVARQLRRWIQSN